MDGYQFTASIFQSIVSVAWPAAIFGVAWLFRQKLFELLPLLRLKYKDVEASFRLDQAEKEAAELPPPAQDAEEPSEPTPEERDKFEQIAELSPRAAMLEVRSDIEEALNRLLQKTGHATDKPQSWLLMTRTLRNTGAIDKLTSALLDDLRVVGNSAAHGGGDQFTKADALRFRQLANQVILRLLDAEVEAVLK